MHLLLFAKTLLLMLRILKCLPIKLLQWVLFICMLPIVLLAMLFKKFLFFQRAYKNYTLACIAHQQKIQKFFLIKHALGLSQIFAQLPSIWLQKNIKLDLSQAQNLANNFKQNQQGTILVIAHLASFEMIPRAVLKILEEHPEKKIYALYKKPHKAYLNPLIQGLRKNLNSERFINVPANFAGVKVLFKALKEGHVLAMVVDQTPQAKAGIWLDWFGVPAYTSSLVYQLASKTAANIFITNIDYQKAVWKMQTERLMINDAADVNPDIDADIDSEMQSMIKISKALENLIIKNPYQYLWGYNRYKNPN